MFCSKCGTQVAETAAFCPKCGQAMKQGSAGSSWNGSGNVESVKHTSAKEPAGKEQSDGLKTSFVALCSDKRFKQALPLVLAVLVVVIVLGIGMKAIAGKDGDTSVGTSQSEAKETVADAKRKEKITELTVDESTVLDGEYTNLERIVSNGATVTLYGKFPSLKTVVMNPDANNKVGDFVFEYGVTFPALISFEGGVIVTNDFDEEGFCTEAFPAIQTMQFYAKNSEVDEFWTQTLATGLWMQDSGLARNVTYEIWHDISDLYGTWTDENNVLALTFQSDGSVRVAESKNIIGVDALTFREVDKDTLMLQTKASGGSSGADLFFGVVSNLISFYMDYELFGDELSVSFNGKEFHLIRE